MTVLLDGNVLVALTVADHVHHDRATTWFAERTDPFATSPITQGTLLRFLVRGGVDPTVAMGILGSLTEHPRHVFWPDDLPYQPSTLRGVVGHRQVTDAYLAASARARGGRLATLDRGLAGAHPDVVQVIEPSGTGPGGS